MFTDESKLGITQGKKRALDVTCHHIQWMINIVILVGTCRPLMSGSLDTPALHSNYPGWFYETMVFF